MKQTRWILESLLVLATLFWCGSVNGQEKTNGVPAALEWTIAYDDAGRVTRMVGPGGKETKIAYKVDEKGQVREVASELSDKSTVNLGFDSFGRRMNMKDAAGSTQYGYDQFGRLTSVRREGAPAVTYTHDTMDRLTSVSVGEGLTTRYAYDFLGRLAGVDTPAGKIAYEYQTGQRMIIRTLPNGIRTVWEYYPDGALKEISHVARDNHVLLQFTYAYRPDGLISGIRELSEQGEKILTYEYDNVQRLAAVSESSGGKTEYRYDKMGNRTEQVVGGQKSEVCEYDWAGRLTRRNGQDCSHDAAGNLCSYPDKDGKREYEFNAMNLLKSAKTAAGRVEYDYDGDGNLIGRTVDAKTTRFVPDPTADIWRPLLATEPDGKKTFYVWEGNVPLVEIRDKETRFFLHDHLGSVRMAAESGGSIVARSDYSPFGELRQRVTHGDASPGFAGLLVDPALGLYLTRVRTYCCVSGGFLQADPQKRVPTGSQKDMSPYAYCGGDPVNYIDTNGAEPTRVDEWFDQHIVWLPKWRSMTVGERFQDFSRALLSGRLVGTARGQEATQWYAEQQVRTGNSWWGVPGGIASLWTEQTFFLTVGTLAGAGTLSGWAAVTGPTVQEAGTAIWVAGQNVMSRLTIFQTAIQTAAMERAVRYGLREPNECLHFPFLRDSIRFYLGNPHWGVNVWGLEHYAWLGVHAYADRLWSPITGSISYETIQQCLPLIPTLPHAIESGMKMIGDWLLPDAEGGEISLRRGGAMSPSSVGGIYLRGAGEALKGLGRLRGVAIDKVNGRLVLLADDKCEVALPPLRLDDVVTVFRSVYEEGDAPYVSIDPNPADPEGPIMIVTNSPATVGTYVGWVLFEADRVMKGYSLGYDNISREPLKTSIPGYRNLFDLGFSSYQEGQKEPNWERFWIVPAEVNRRPDGKKQLTLLDAPLKVKTQRMEWKNGKLVPAMEQRGGLAVEKPPSEQATIFSEWFTSNYTGIAREVLSRPPRESGIDGPVAFFEELQRIALATAMAETLRDQGVPMPGWMREYRVKPTPVSATTPSIVVSATKTQTKSTVEGRWMRTTETVHEQRIYGGVRLSPTDDKLLTATGDPAAERLAPRIEEAVRTLPTTAMGALPEIKISENGAERRYRVVAMPGANSRDVGACRLSETDLSVPVQRGTQITLGRSFNSFFQPEEGFGTGWTLNLPVLVAQKRPTKRSEEGSSYEAGFLLTDSLGGIHTTFNKRKTVPELKVEALVTDDSAAILGLTGTRNERVGHDTQVVLFRDGRQWLFEDDGRMAAWVQAPLTVVYRRDSGHRIQRIEGWYGKDLRADIQLTYDARGRVISAKGSDGAEVKYGYDGAGQLTSVQGPDSKSGYEYENGLVAAVARNGKVARRFAYDAHGRLQKESGADGGEIAYRVSAAQDGVKISAVSSDAKTAEATAQYDVGLRPVSRVFPDGTRVQWQYDDKGVTETTTTPRGQQYVFRRSADGRKTERQTPDGLRYGTELDEAGRPIAVSAGGQTAVRYEWQGDGQLARAVYETTAVHPQYREGGILTSVVLGPPEEAGKSLSRWVQVEYDELGRIVKTTDFAGADTRILYDKTGQPAVWGSPSSDGKIQGVQMERDARGRVVKVGTSWGYVQENRYDEKSGDLKRSDFKQGDATACIEYEGGRVVKARQFDGGEYSVTYHTEGPRKGLPRMVSTPNGLTLAYDYDAGNRIAAVTCGDVYALKLAYDAQGRLTRLRIAECGSRNAE